MLHVADEFAPVLADLLFTAEMVFQHPDVKPWRQLADRENCLWDIRRPDGSTLRLHVKRYPPGRHRVAKQEADSYRDLRQAAVPTAKLAAWGTLADGRSFVMIEDLAGFAAADKLIAAGAPFEKLLIPTADLAAALHNAGFHHRDLYLCHFFAKVDGGGVDVRLIDIARVRRLPALLTRRWITKDLAQFWYSTLALPITDPQRDQWLARYARQTRAADVERLRRAVERKSRFIATHDAKLRARQPHRNISIPTTE
ncbi:MAG: lipopolysaccharide kinase InaA family protein [Tepidisphaeraceae bacterium]|jgi:hypothetical protein